MLVDRQVTQLFRDRVVDEQGPAAGSAGSGLELALPGVVRAEILRDAVGEFALRLAAAVGDMFSQNSVWR